MTTNQGTNLRTTASQPMGYGVTSFPDAATTKQVLHAQIEEQQALLKEAESLAQMGSWKWTEINEQLHWSDGLYKIFDKNPDELITWSSFLENVLPADVQLMSDYLNDVKTNENGCVIYYRTQKNEGIRYFSLNSKPHTAFDTDIIGAVVDITHHMENQQRLEDSKLLQSRIIRELDENEKRYRTLFERSIDPIFLLNKSMDFISVNESFLKLLGYPEVNESAVSLQTIFSSMAEYELFTNTIERDGQIREFEGALVSRSGEIKYCLLNCVFISDPVEANCCYQGIIHDLTLRKQAESEMLVAERLALTGKIARTIAHEVRNPLTNINLALDQLMEELPGTNASAKLFGDIIGRNANRIEELMGEMLNTSRSKQLNLELTQVDDLLTETIKMAQDRINLNQIKLIVNRGDGLPRLLVDRSKIEIAFLNIIINAIEAMTPGEGVLNINAAHHGDQLTIDIADNGIGISPSDIKRVFDPFFTGKQTGIGLGLTSAKNILHSHNAQVEVTSNVGIGTVFHIQFKLSN